MPALSTELLGVGTAGLLVAVGFLLIASFQVALATGAPLGHAAWGGAHDVLPRRLRIASAVAVGIWLLAAIVVTDRAGISIVPLPAVVARWGTWLIVALLVLGAIMNAASSSRWERFGWAPFTLILASLCLYVALNGPEPTSG